MAETKVEPQRGLREGRAGRQLGLVVQVAELAQLVVWELIAGAGRALEPAVGLGALEVFVAGEVGIVDGDGLIELAVEPGELGRVVHESRRPQARGFEDHLEHAAGRESRDRCEVVDAGVGVRERQDEGVGQHPHLEGVHEMGLGALHQATELEHAASKP